MGSPVYTCKLRNLQVLALCKVLQGAIHNLLIHKLYLENISVSQGKAGLLDPWDGFVRALLKALLEGGFGESCIHLFLPPTCYVRMM